MTKLLIWTDDKIYWAVQTIKPTEQYRQEVTTKPTQQYRQQNLLSSTDNNKREKRHRKTETKRERNTHTHGVQGLTLTASSWVLQTGHLYRLLPVSTSGLQKVLCSDSCRPLGNPSTGTKRSENPVWSTQTTGWVNPSTGTKRSENPVWSTQTTGWVNPSTGTKRPDNPVWSTQTPGSQITHPQAQRTSSDWHKQQGHS